MARRRTPHLLPLTVLLMAGGVGLAGEAVVDARHFASTSVTAALTPEDVGQAVRPARAEIGEGAGTRAGSAPGGPFQPSAAPVVMVGLTCLAAVTGLTLPVGQPSRRTRRHQVRLRAPPPIRLA